MLLERAARTLDSSSSIERESALMRAAAFFAASLIAIGLYVAVASALAFTTTWIGLGVLAIAATAALTLVATERGIAPVEG